MESPADPGEVGSSHDTLRLHPARLGRQGMEMKANSTYASQVPPNPKRGINTIFNHFCNRLARGIDGLFYFFMSHRL